MPYRVRRHPGRLLFRLKLEAASFMSASCCPWRGDEFDKLLIVDRPDVDCSVLVFDCRLKVGRLLVDRKVSAGRFRSAPATLVSPGASDVVCT